MKEPETYQRTFTVFLRPNVADPAWIIKVVEDDKMFNSTNRIRECIDKMDKDQIEIEARSSERKTVLDLMGISFDEYIKKLRESR